MSCQSTDAAQGQGPYPSCPQRGKRGASDRRHGGSVHAEGSQGSVSLPASTLVTVQRGKATVPVLNLVGKTAKLPGREALGTWTPLDGEMEILYLEGELDRERVSEWLETLGTKLPPLSNEEELAIEAKDRDLLLKLL